MEKIYINTQEVAEIVGLKPGTIYLKRQLGKFPPARKTGKILLYKKDEIMEWIESTKEQRGDV